MMDDDKDWVDAEGYADMLGLDSAEQLKRLARKGVLAPRIPHVKQWRWYKKDIETRIKQKQRAGDIFRKTAMGIASNLRTCRYDSVICSSPLDKIGSNVYGRELVLGIKATGRGEPMTLVKIDGAVSLNALEPLRK